MAKYHIGNVISILRPGEEFVFYGDKYADLEWKASTTKPTETELNNKVSEMNAAEPMRLLREERNKLIAETDWTQLKDIDLDIIRERNWKNYRQALRDLPNGSTPKLDSFGNLDLSSVSWPDKPSK